MELAKEGREGEGQKPRLIDSYWLCTGPHFEVILTRTDNQVTRLILTPHVPVNLPVTVRPGVENIWVVKLGSPAKQVEQDDPRFPKREEKGHQIETVRLKKT